MMLPAPFPQAAISLRFGATSAPYSPSNPHKGTDYSNSALGVWAGASILASAPGTVVRNGWEPGEQAPTQNRPNKWAGNAIDVDYVVSGQRITVRYMHRPSMVVGPPVGTRVGLGTYLGVIGDTGFVTGAHLHHEVWVNGARVSPSRYFDLTTSVAAAILAGGNATPWEDDLDAVQDQKLTQTWEMAGAIKQLLTETQQWKGIGALVSETYQMVGVVKQLLMETDQWEGALAVLSRVAGVVTQIQIDAAAASASDAARDAAIATAIEAMGAPEGVDLGELRQVLTDAASTAATAAIQAADFPTEQSIVAALSAEADRRALKDARAEVERLQNELDMAHAITVAEQQRDA